MYITRVEIENIKSIKHLVWEIDADNAPGWHVILGNNGAGKSTFVKAVALSILGERDSLALRIDLNSWLRRDSKSGTVRVAIANNPHYAEDFSNQHNNGWLPRRTGIRLVRVGNGVRLTLAPGAPKFFLEGSGWFAASFGAFRRFGGGDSESETLQKSQLPFARHISAFKEGVALTEGIEWLKQLKFETLEGNPVSTSLYNQIIRLFQQPELLSNGVKVRDVTSAGVHCVDGNGADVLVEDLADGYRSVLSMMFELLRQIVLSYGVDVFEERDSDKIAVKVPGVVQIDEVDAHLHPTWQRKIGFWLREHFPKIQFIVTTHSPFICQAAEKGSIFRLPTPGTQEKGQLLSGNDFNQLVYGNVLDAYSTQAFGYGITRSQSSLNKLNRLADLNMKEAMHGLSAEEIVERESLREMLPTTASILQRV